MSRTLPPARTEPGERLVTGPVLHRILTASAVTEGASRHRLGSVARVEIKRGTPSRWERDGDVLTLWVNDASISSRHCELLKTESGWQIADLGSTHGTRVDGVPVERSELANGAMIEAGTTFFRFATARADRRDLPDDLGSTASSVYPGLRSLHPALSTRFGELLLLASSTVPLWISGATGTGKELVARAIHEASGRTGAFVPVNCAALPETLAESELFGYVKGAFSGATQGKTGLLEASDGGTLFLDEIAELSSTTQARLLRALQEREIRPVGATSAQPVDLRVVAATHADMTAEIAAGEFREDLYARLAGAEIRMPPLVERIEDLGLIIAALAKSLDCPRVALTPDAARRLLAHAWPRNIRELEQTLRRAIALSTDGLIRSTHLGELKVATPKRRRKLTAEDEARRGILVELLAEHRGNVSAVARAMSKGRRQIQRWVQRYELTPSDYA